MDLEDPKTPVELRKWHRRTGDRNLALLTRQTRPLAIIQVKWARIPQNDHNAGI